MPPRGPVHWCQADQLPARVESATKMRKLRGVDLISDALPFAQSVTQSFSAAHILL
jgi:hypothetical protein